MLGLIFGVLAGLILGQFLPIQVRSWAWGLADWVRGRFTRSAPAVVTKNAKSDIRLQNERYQRVEPPGNPGGLNLQNARSSSEVSPPPPNKPIRWGKAIANIGSFIWRWKWALLVLVLFIAFSAWRAGAWSPFDLFGPSKAELRFEAAAARAEAAARQAEAALAGFAAERAEQTHRAERRVSQAVSQAQQDITDAAQAIDPDALYGVYADAYRSLRPDHSNQGDAHPPPFGPDRVRGAGANPV